MAFIRTKSCFLLQIGWERDQVIFFISNALILFQMSWEGCRLPWSHFKAAGPISNGLRRLQVGLISFQTDRSDFKWTDTTAGCPDFISNGLISFQMDWDGCRLPWFHFKWAGTAAVCSDPISNTLIWFQNGLGRLRFAFFPGPLSSALPICAASLRHHPAVYHIVLSFYHKLVKGPLLLQGIGPLLVHNIHFSR